MPQSSRICLWGGAIYNIPINTIWGQKEPADNPILTLCISQAIKKLFSHSFTEWNMLDLTEYNLYSVIWGSPKV